MRASLLLLLTALLCFSVAAFAVQAPGVAMFHIQGSVLDALGHPIPSAMVQLTSAAGSPMQTQTTNQMGAFNFAVATPGPYDAIVITSFGSESVHINNESLGNVVIRLNHKPAPQPTSTHALVSLNDLEAPSKAKSTLAKADKALQKDDLPSAWKFVNQAIQEAPDWGRPHLLRGVLNFNSHNYAAARSDFQITVEKDPYNGMAMTQLGKLDAETGDYTRARTYLQRALQLPPVQWPTYLEMARLDLFEHNYLEADQMAHSAMSCTPAPPPVIHFLDGSAAYHLSHFRRAAAEFTQFLALTPDTPTYAHIRAAARHDLEMAQAQVRHP